MIAVDTSSVIAYLSGESGPDVDQLEQALEQGGVVFAPMVLTELLSDSNLSATIVRLLKRIPLLEVTPGYWERAGLLRAKILARGHKASSADTLIAQSCIDHGVPLIARDRDYRHFRRIGGLVLFP